MRRLFNRRKADESVTGKNDGYSRFDRSGDCLDLLIATKSGVRNYAIALTEAPSLHVRQTRRHLGDAIRAHELVSAYMAKEGWHLAYDMSAQVQLDLQNAGTAMNLQQ